MEFIEIVRRIQKFMNEMDNDFMYEYEDQLEIIFFRLKQIVVCVRYLEQTIRADNAQHNILPVGTVKLR